MNQYQITQYEAWLADLMDADVEHFQATRYTDDEGVVGYSGLSEWYSEDADSLAMMGIQAWQAACEQGADPVGIVRHRTDPRSDNPDAYIDWLFGGDVHNMPEGTEIYTQSPREQEGK